MGAALQGRCRGTKWGVGERTTRTQTQCDPHPRPVRLALQLRNAYNSAGREGAGQDPVAAPAPQRPSVHRCAALPGQGAGVARCCCRRHRCRCRRRRRGRHHGGGARRLGWRRRRCCRRGRSCRRLGEAKANHARLRVRSRVSWENCRAGGLVGQGLADVREQMEGSDSQGHQHASSMSGGK